MTKRKLVSLPEDKPRPWEARKESPTRHALPTSNKPKTINKQTHNMKLTCQTLMTILLATLTLAACEKPLTGTDDGGDDPGEPKGDEVRVTFNVNGIEQVPFGAQAQTPRKTSNVSEVCTRISFAMFEGEDIVDGTTQASGDNNFGRIALNVEKGTYDVVVIAHNGLGNATINSPSEIKFKDNKVTDTFYYYGVITIDGDKSYDLTLKRAVAMFRLAVNDNTPSNAKQMKFYYTGGSSTFDAVTGYGCVNSRQTELRDIEPSAYTSASKYEVYTFPHSNGKALTMRVSALDNTGSTVYEREFANVPVERNRVTQYTGNFFGESPGGGRVIELQVDDSWTQTEYEY